MKTSQAFRSRKARSGFTLVEVMVSIGLLSLVAIYFVQYQIDSVNQRMAEAVAQDMLSIANASVSHYSEEMQWPDEDGDCAALLTGDLVPGNAFPPNLIPPLGVTYEFDCSDNAEYGRVLKIAAVFPPSERDSADILLSYLPTSDLEATDESITVIHYVSQPRKATRRYQFQKPTVSNSGRITVNKPSCWGDQTQSYMLIPQAVCVTDARHGLGGFYFRETSDSDDDNWIIELMVAQGAEDGLGGFRAYNNDCGETIQVGAIAYCE